MFIILLKGTPISCPFFWREEPSTWSLGVPADSQGGRTWSRDEDGVGPGHRQLDIVSDTSRMPSKAPRGLGRRVSGQTTGQEEGGNLTYFIFTKEFLFSWI